MADEKNFKRSIKNYFIFPKYQLKFMFWVIVPAVLLVAIYFGIFYSFINENYETFVELGPMSDEAKVVMNNELTSITYRLIASSIIFLVILCLIAVVISHKAAGPIYKLKKEFIRLKSKNSIPDQKLFLRNGDDFNELFKTYNEYVESLKKK